MPFFAKMMIHSYIVLSILVMSFPLVFIVCTVGVAVSLRVKLSVRQSVYWSRVASATGASLQALAINPNNRHRKVYWLEYYLSLKSIQTWYDPILYLVWGEIVTASLNHFRMYDWVWQYQNNRRYKNTVPRLKYINVLCVIEVVSECLWLMFIINCISIKWLYSSPVVSKCR